MSVTTIGDFSIILGGDPRPLEQAISRSGLALAAFGGVIKGVGQDLQQMFGNVIDVAADYEQAITNTTVVTGRVGESFKAARQEVDNLSRDLSGKTVFSANEVAKALEDLARKGFDPVNLSAAQVKPILDLAVASQTDLALSSQIVTSTLHIFNMEFSQSEYIANLFTAAANKSNLAVSDLATAMPYLGPLVAATNIPLDEMVSVLSALADRGFPATIAATALRRVVADLISPSKKFREVLADLGLTEADVNVKTLGLTTVLGNLAQAGLSAEQAMQVFEQRGGPTAIALTNTSQGARGASTAIEAFRVDLVNSASAAEVAAQQMGTYESQTKRLEAVMGQLRIEMAEGVLPLFTSLKATVAEGALSVVKLANSAGPLGEILLLAAGGVGVLLGVGGSLLIKLGLLEVALGLFGYSLKGIIPWLGATSVATQGLAVSMTALGYAIPIVGAALAAWGISSWLRSIEGFDEGVQSVILSIMGLGAEAQKQEIILNQSFTKQAELFKVYADSAKVAYREFEQGNFDVAVEFAQKAVDARLQQVANRKRELEEELVLMQQHFAELEKLEGADFEAHSAQLERKKAAIKQHEDAITELTKSGAAERLLAQRDSAEKEIEHREAVGVSFATVMREIEERHGKFVENWKAGQEQIKAADQTIWQWMKQQANSFMDTVIPTLTTYRGELDQVQIALEGWKTGSDAAYRVITTGLGELKRSTLATHGEITADDQAFLDGAIARLDQYGGATKENLEKVGQAWLDWRNKNKEISDQIVKDMDLTRAQIATSFDSLVAANRVGTSNAIRVLNDYADGADNIWDQATRRAQNFADSAVPTWRVIAENMETGARAALIPIGNFTAEEARYLQMAVNSLVAMGQATQQNLNQLGEIWSRWVVQHRQQLADLAQAQANYVQEQYEMFLKQEKQMNEAIERQAVATRALKSITFTYTQETIVWYKALAAVAEFSNATMKTTHDLLLPFVFEQKELMELWASFTQDTKNKLIQYYLDIADGITESTGSIKDILEDMVGHSWYTEYMEMLRGVTTENLTAVVGEWSRAAREMPRLMQMIQSVIQDPIPVPKPPVRKVPGGFDFDAYLASLEPDQRSMAEADWNAYQENWKLLHKKDGMTASDLMDVLSNLYRPGTFTSGGLATMRRTDRGNYNRLEQEAIEYLQGLIDAYEDNEFFDEFRKPPSREVGNKPLVSGIQNPPPGGAKPPISPLPYTGPHPSDPYSAPNSYGSNNQARVMGSLIYRVRDPWGSPMTQEPYTIPRGRQDIYEVLESGFEMVASRIEEHISVGRTGNETLRRTPREIAEALPKPGTNQSVISAGMPR